MGSAFRAGAPSALPVGSGPAVRRPERATQTQPRARPPRPLPWVKRHPHPSSFPLPVWRARGAPNRKGKEGIHSGHAPLPWAMVSSSLQDFSRARCARIADQRPELSGAVSPVPFRNARREPAPTDPPAPPPNAIPCARRAALPPGRFLSRPTRYPGQPRPANHPNTRWAPYAKRSRAEAKPPSPGGDDPPADNVLKYTPLTNRRCPFAAAAFNPGMQLTLRSAPR